MGAGAVCAFPQEPVARPAEAECLGAASSSRDITTHLRGIKARAPISEVREGAVALGSLSLPPITLTQHH